jgi:hypothetical protein
MVSVVRTRCEAQVATCRWQRQKIELLALTTTYLKKLTLSQNGRVHKVFVHMAYGGAEI